MIVLEAVFPVVFIIGLGWYLRRVEILTDKVTHTLTRLVYFVLFPAALFSFSAGADMSMFEKTDYILVLYISTFVICLASFSWYRRLNAQNNFKQGIIFNLHSSVSNIAFVGYPIFNALYGEEGIAYVVIGVFLISCIITPMSIVALNYNNLDTWTQRIRGFIKTLLTDPLLISVSLGLLLAWQDIRLPVFLSSPIELLAQSCIPMILLAIGASFTFSSTKMDNAVINRALLLKNLLHPLVAVVIVLLLGLGSNAAWAAVMAAALPTFKAATIFSMKHQIYEQESPRIVVKSTLLSLVSLSLLILIIQSIQTS